MLIWGFGRLAKHLRLKVVLGPGADHLVQIHLLRTVGTVVFFNTKKWRTNARKNW